MPQAAQRAPFPPPPPDQPVQEGARWRWHRPKSEDVAAWFKTQPLDEGMEHDGYVGGVVLIPQTEKVKYTNPDGRGTTDRFEQVFTPYVQIGTRVAYFRHLAEHRALIPWNGPAKVPRTMNSESIYFNGNMTDGLWWHVVRGEGGQPVRFLCCTWEVMMFEPQSYAAKMRGEDPLPRAYGQGTKLVSGGADINGIAKAQTGAYGRALGAAGILVVGTGIASAEDMQEYGGQAVAAPTGADAQLPAPTEVPGTPAEPVDPSEALSALRAQAMALQATMQEETPQKWREFAAWWQERMKESGWSSLGDAPYEALRGIVARMEQLYSEGRAAADRPAEVAP